MNSLTVDTQTCKVNKYTFILYHVHSGKKYFYFNKNIGFTHNWRKGAFVFLTLTRTRQLG